VLQRLSLVRAIAIVGALALPVHAATVPATAVTPGVASDSTPEPATMPTTDTTSSAPSHPGTLGLATASCQLGASLAFANPYQMAGVGIALCLAGMVFELDAGIEFIRS